MISNFQKNKNILPKKSLDSLDSRLVSLMRNCGKGCMLRLQRRRVKDRLPGKQIVNGKFAIKNRKYFFEYEGKNRFA